ncbi:hypothetical protein [Desulfofustis glycolicus]|uniref:Uncharacterized protein n=1 Tax=Desulfofustis glycolicus DSM 9705 TaxID=1121409 RepID=A0A1M5XXS4_9BACT|nr:hypothetical protein [Desulfofustis glycolicus]SHI04617.1 hypothetical protein SAMN02745124_03453 [Desulfofustis glycolicus DSM 9705]
MKVTAWNDGKKTYGIRVGIRNRDRFFNKSWRNIEVDIEGSIYQFKLTPGFWKHCPEFRDSVKPTIREWLEKYNLVGWPKRKPPRFELVQIDNNKFRLEKYKISL